MSILSDEQASRAVPKHQQVNGEDVTRLTSEGDIVVPGGAVWVEYSEDQLSSQRPKRDLDEGFRFVRHGLLEVPRDFIVAESDRWRILGEIWNVQRIGAIGSGYREVYLELDDKRRTSRVDKRDLII